MLLLIETWPSACSWPSSWTSRSIVRLISARRCSSQVSGIACAGPWPWSRRASSATKALDIWGSDRAMSASVRIRLVGSFSATSIIRSAQWFAWLRASRLATMRDATRRRLLISARRSMIGIAQSSPSLSGLTVW